MYNPHRLKKLPLSQSDPIMAPVTRAQEQKDESRNKDVKITLYWYGYSLFTHLPFSYSVLSRTLYTPSPTAQND